MQRPLTLLDGEVLRWNVLDVLVGHRVSERLQLLGRAPIVLEHDEEGFGASERTLSGLASHSHVSAAENAPLVTTPSRSFRKEPIVYLLDCTSKQR